MKIVYLVPDQHDPAVRRRIIMLERGGAEVQLVGFRRGADTVDGSIDLGRTYDARMAHRAWMVGRARLRLSRWAVAVPAADVILARSLETLVLAAALIRRTPQARLAYECLDVHRLMVGRRPLNRLLRTLERTALERTQALIVSSPAFLREYFNVMQPFRGEVRLVENKVLAPGEDASVATGPPSAPPWRIGWFGALRCRRSLDILTDALRRRPDLLSVVLRGRPALDQVGDVEQLARTTPGLSYEGPYVAAELPSIYGNVHFAWGVDYMEEGLNSTWLLPNRLYEAPAHGAPVIAAAGTETARRVDALGCGQVLRDPARDLVPWLEELSAESWSRRRDALASIPAGKLVVDDEECRDLVAFLAGARG